MIKQHKNRNAVLNAGSVAKGVIWLSAAGILVKVIGLLFKIPLTNMIGASGMGYFGSAYTVYSFFYTVSTAGLPVALSITVSSALAKGDEKLAKKSFSLSLLMFACLGALLSLAMFFGSGLLSDFVSNPGAIYAISAMAPTLLCVCIASAYRGYFQGRGSMAQTAISQIIESFGKLVLGILLAGYAIKQGYSAPVTAGYAVLGITLSEALSMIYLAVAKRFKKMQSVASLSEKSQYSNFTIIKKLVKLALPVSLGSAVMSLSGMLDLAIVMKRLQHIGFSPEVSNAMFGNYTSLAVPMFNMPAVLITPISCALVPFIASAMASGKREKALSGAENCLKYATVIALPCSVGLSVLSEPVLKLIFNESLAEAAFPYLSMLALAIVFVAYTNVCIAIMQSCGHMLLPIMIMGVGSVVKLISAWFLIEKYQMMGTPLSTIVCYAVMSVICFAFLDKKLSIRINMFKMTALPLFAATVCAVTANVSYRTLSINLGSYACLPAIALAALVYFALLLVCRYIKKDEIMSLPIFNRIKENKKDNYKNGYEGNN